MEEAIHSFPDYLLESEKICGDFSFPRADFERVVLLGMGGSAIGGDLIRVLAEREETVPVAIVRDETIPGYVDEKTLVIAISYSGNTRETLSALRQSVLKSRSVIGISTGGELKEIAFRENFPHIEIPGGLMPRAALPFTFVPLLSILQKNGLLPDKRGEVQEAAAILKEMRSDLASSSGEASLLAKSLQGKIPVVYAGNPQLAPAARRWKCQINENAKQPAFFDNFPEVAHNEIVAFTHKLPFHSSLSCVILRGQEESIAEKKRIAFAVKALSGAVAAVREIIARGKSFLCRLLSLCYYGDYVSLHLAKENRVDPLPIAMIEKMKKELE